MKFIALIAFALLFISSTQAQGCPRACPLNYAPVCGFNGRCYREFPNTCSLSASVCDGGGTFRQVNSNACRNAARRC